MRAFVKNGVEYSVKQDFGSTGIQYKAKYISEQVVTEAFAFLCGRKHTKQQIIDAIDNVNNSQNM